MWHRGAGGDGFMLKKPRSLAVAVMTIASLFACKGAGLCQEQLPLYEQEAYDLITLAAEHGGQTLKVLPLPFPNRRVPDPLPRTGNLQFRLVDQPDVLYEVPWAAVAKIELFHDLVLARARQLVDENKFEQAYDYFMYLLENDPTLPGLTEAYHHFLFSEASWCQAREQHDRALMIFLQLAQVRRDYPGLAEAVGGSVWAKLDAYLREENYAGAYTLLRGIEKLFAGHPAVQKGREELVRRASTQLEEARRQAELGHLSLAHRLVRRSLGIWPELKEAIVFQEELQRKYTRVVVGVTEALPQGRWQPLVDWASRRVMRLVARSLFEFAGPSLEGGRYICSVGEHEWDRPTLRLTIRLRPGIADPSSQSEELTAPRLVPLLFPGGQGQAFRAYPEPKEFIRQISCPDLYTVELQLGRLHLRPEAVMTIPLALSPLVLLGAEDHSSATAAGQTTAMGNGQSGSTDSADRSLPSWAYQIWVGPYRLTEIDENQTIFRPVPSSFAGRSEEVHEIVEMSFPSAGAAIEALRRGEVDVVDRVPPWMLERLTGLPGITVEPYGLPLVHCLLPNMQKPLMRRSAFRRGLLYGIDRQKILAQLMGKAKSETASLVTGPFLATAGPGVPLDYAYDSGVPVKAYDPRLAIALVQVAFAEWRSELPEEQRPGGLPEIVLAYKPGPIAQTACEALREDWRRVGLRVRLTPLEWTEVNSFLPEVDLIYAELAVWEPLVDVERIFGSEGLTGFVTAHLAQSLVRLRELRDWSEVAAQLRRIHRLVDLQSAILPLWQLPDYFARKHSVQGIGTRPITLYQNVENWRFLQGATGSKQ